MAMPGTRAEKIAAIHKQRESAVHVAEGLNKHLSEVGARLGDLERVRAELLGRAADEDAQGLLQSWAVPLRDLSDQVVRERAALDRALTRLSRPALNIGMVGRARQGKSRFLQSLTGLTSREIPDGEAGFCTGVPSIVQHVPGSETYADVYFHSPESFLAEVIIPYYERLGMNPKPVSPAAFAGAPLAALPVGLSSEDEAAYGHLAAYHRAFHEYQPLIGAMSPRRIGAAEIRSYVAQDDETGQRRYHAFRAVRRVQIATAFRQQDLGGIAVIDLPGLGDTNLGDSRVMLSALQDDVDLVLFLRRPAADGDAIHEFDVKLYDLARDSLPEIPMQRRAFLIVNHRRSSDPAHDNKARCEEFAAQVAGSPIRVAEVKMADCASEEEVAAAFEHVVDYLLKNVSDLDKLLLDERSRRVAEIDEQARLLLAQLESLGLHARSAGEWTPEFLGLFNETYENLAVGVEELVLRYKLRRDENDGHLKEAVTETLAGARADDGIPPISQIERRIRVDGGHGLAYGHLLNEARAQLSKHFLHLDTALREAVKQMWAEVAEVLAESGSLGQIAGLADLTGRDFLIALAERIPTRVRSDREDSEVRYALGIMIEFDLSYRSFIQHRVRDCLDGMDPDAPRVAVPPGLSPPPDAPFLHEALVQTYKATLWDCEQRLQELLKEPNKALFGIVEEFCDRVLRSIRIKDEWQAIYQDIRAEVWADRFTALAESAAHLRMWNEAVQQLRAIVAVPARRDPAASRAR